MTRCWTVMALSMLACQNGPVARVEPREPRSAEEPGDEVAARHDPEPAETEPPPRGPESPVEIPLPRPALWVEISLGEPIVAGMWRPRGQCASVWLDEAQRVEWLEGGRTVVVNDALSSAWGRAGAFHDSPVGSNTICDVTSRAELRCRRYPCASIWENEGGDSAARARCRIDPPPGRQSDIQRTRGFVPTRHWLQANYFSTPLSYTCLRAGGQLSCYLIRDGVRRPERVTTPELSAWSDVRDLAAGGSQACAVLGDGSVHCWGMPYMPRVAADRSNEEAVFEAMLEHSGHPWTPRRIDGLPPVAQISVGPTLACARTADGRVFCWGAPECLERPAFPSQ